MGRLRRKNRRGRGGGGGGGSRRGSDTCFTQVGYSTVATTVSR